MAGGVFFRRSQRLAISGTVARLYSVLQTGGASPKEPSSGEIVGEPAEIPAASCRPVLEKAVTKPASFSPYTASVRAAPLVLVLVIR